MGKDDTGDWEAAMQVEDIAVGDSVRTKVQMYFVDARHPQTNDEIEVVFPRWHRLTVCGVGKDDIAVELPDGYVATLSREDVEL